MEKLTHYKRLANPDYLGAYSLYDNEGKASDLVVTLKKIERKEVIGDGGKKEMCMVAEVHGNKPLILNATNQKMLVKLTGSPFIERWVDVPITLYVTTTKLKGEVTECLRIRDKMPAQALPELSPSHEKWNEALTALAQGSATIPAIKKHYTLSPANEKLLIDAAAASI